MGSSWAPVGPSWAPVGNAAWEVKPYWLMFNNQLDLGAHLGAHSQPLQLYIPGV